MTHMEYVSGEASRETATVAPKAPSRSVTARQRAAKRALDVVGSAVGLLAASPLFVLIAVRIKLDSRGPVFFRQARLGEGGREFTMLKFRTMRIDTTEDAHRAYIEDTMSGGAPVTNGLYKLERDEVTCFGRWLRKTSLDELPQLLNVLRGEMSLVGPRPCLAYEVPFFEPHHFERFTVPAGITGLWQAHKRAHADFREALELDVEYVRTFSLWNDLRLLVLTIPSLLGKATV